MAHEWRNCFKMCKIASTFDAPSSVTSMPVCPSLDPAGPWCACRPRDINLIRHDDGSTDAWAACQSPQPRLMRQTTAAANARMMTAAAVCTSEVQSKNWHWRRTDAVSACVFLIVINNYEVRLSLTKKPRDARSSTARVLYGKAVSDCRPIYIAYLVILCQLSAYEIKTVSLCVINRYKNSRLIWRQLTLIH